MNILFRKDDGLIVCKTNAEIQNDDATLDVASFDGLIPAGTLLWDGEKVVPFEESQAETVAGRREYVFHVLNEACVAQITSGFVSNALGSDHVYDSGEVDQINLIGAVMSGVDRVYKCTNATTGVKDWHLHTAAQLQQVLADGAAFKEAQLTHVTTLKAQAQAATTIEELEAIQW